MDHHNYLVIARISYQVKNIYKELGPENYLVISGILLYQISLY